MKKRIPFIILFLLLTAVEVYIALFIHDVFIRSYFGDVLVVIDLWFLIRIFFPDRWRLLFLYIFIFACFVEFMQYLDIVHFLGLQDSAFFSVIIGTSFSWLDILSYAAGCAVIAIIDLLRLRKLKPEE